MKSRLAMSSIFVTVLMLFVAVCSNLYSLDAPTFPQGVISGRVDHVSDGDTLTLLSGMQHHKVRLFAIDAPEHDQPFGALAKKNLVDLVQDKTVIVRWQQRDRYHRIVGQVLIKNPQCKTTECESEIDINQQQIRSGYAWWYRQYAEQQSPTDAAKYELAEQQARKNRVGLWSKPNPKAPWLWRRKNRR